jgi:hypothetical protein
MLDIILGDLNLLPMSRLVGISFVDPGVQVLDIASEPRVALDISDAYAIPRVLGEQSHKEVPKIIVYLLIVKLVRSSLVGCHGC